MEEPNIVEEVSTRRESLKHFVACLQGPDKDKLLESIKLSGESVKTPVKETNALAVVMKARRTTPRRRGIPSLKTKSLKGRGQKRGPSSPPEMQYSLPPQPGQ